MRAGRTQAVTSSADQWARCDGRCSSGTGFRPAHIVMIVKGHHRAIRPKTLCSGQWIHEWCRDFSTPSRDIATRCGSGQWIKAFALSRGTRAKTDRIDAELIARFMACRPRAGRERPDENLRILRTLVARSGQLVDMRMRLKPRSGLERSRAFLPVSRA